MTHSSKSRQVSSSGLSNSWLINRDNSSVRMGNKSIVSWSSGWDSRNSSIGSMSQRSSSWSIGSSGDSWNSSSIGSMSNWSSDWRGSVGSMSSNSFSIEMISSSSSNSRLINWNILIWCYSVLSEIRISSLCVFYDN